MGWIVMFYNDHLHTNVVEQRMKIFEYFCKICNKYYNKKHHTLKLMNYYASSSTTTTTTTTTSSKNIEIESIPTTTATKIQNNS